MTNTTCDHSFNSSRRTTIQNQSAVRYQKQNFDYNLLDLLLFRFKLIAVMFLVNMMII